MKLKRIEIVGLYGTFSAAIDFKKNLNLLVGINGSGKTSVLNCLDWMLRPDLARLAMTRFVRITVEFVRGRKLYRLTALHEGEQMRIVEESSGLFPHPILVHLIANPERWATEKDLAAIFQTYRRLSPESDERPLWKFLHDLDNPLLITLDRSILAETDDAVYVDRGVRIRAQAQEKSRTPLEKVRDVARERYAAYRERMNALNQRLQSRLVVSAFSVPLFKPQKKARKVSLSDIEKLERKVSSHLVPALSIESSAQQVSSFFTAAKSFVREFGDDEKMRPFFWSSFQQIDHLAEAFEEYEKDASLAYEAVGSYLRSVNSFLVDSGKIVGFNELDGSLGFQFLAGATKQASGSYYPLDSLSSGERQIIILLSFMAFMLDRDKVFIVDEPELSLHPKWQANFLASIIEQAPPDTQIVLATHSPEIAAGRRENCIILDAI